jgi:hypothetical protein
MSYLPPEKKDPKKITSTRVAIWVLVGGFGLYTLLQGVIAIASN